MATTTTANAAAGNKSLVTEDMDFMDEYAGQGLDTISSNEQAIAYLGLVQPDSQFVSDDCPAGSWRNSATGKCYGTNVRVVPLAFRTVWNEREADPPFTTVARYAPNSIEVEVKPVKNGKRGFPKMFNKETGNEIQELYIYAVTLPDHPEDGVLYFNPTVGSMRACKSWNTQLKGQLLPNGKQAPIFGFTWNLLAELVPNPQQPSKEIARFTKAVKDVVVTKDLFEASVKPQLTAVTQNVLAITSDVDASDSEED